MDPDTNLTAFIINHAVTFMVGVVVTVLGWFLLRKRKVLKYEVVSLPVLHDSASTKLPEGVQIAVRQSVYSGNDKDDEMLPADDPVVTSIRFKNVGNETAEDVSVKISLQEGAILVSGTTTPAPSDAYDIKFDTAFKSPNEGLLTIPYVNAKDKVSVSIFSVFNGELDTCDVEAYGKGVKVAKQSPPKLEWVFMFAAGAGVAGTAATLGQFMGAESAVVAGYTLSEAFEHWENAANAMKSLWTTVVSVSFVAIGAGLVLILQRFR